MLAIVVMLVMVLLVLQLIYRFYKSSTIRNTPQWRFFFVLASSEQPVLYVY